MALIVDDAILVLLNTYHPAYITFANIIFPKETLIFWRIMPNSESSVSESKSEQKESHEDRELRIEIIRKERLRAKSIRHKVSQVSAQTLTLS